jgi:hypothetical protein
VEETLPPVAAPAATSDAPAPEAPQRERLLLLLSRIGVVGASGSAGFGPSVPLVSALDLALRAPHSVYDVSSSAFFMQPMDIARIQIEAVRAREATVIVAVDFLFWFAYGVKSPAARHDDLRVGMAMLEELGVPVFVGDLPDVHGASRRMISPSQIPAAEQLARLNAEIAEWAAQHPRMHRLPMAAWMHTLKQERSIPLWGHTYEPRTGEVLQWDLLHPTTEGQAVLALLVLQQIDSVIGGFGEGDVLARPGEVAAGLRPRTDGAERSLPPPPP